MRVGSVRALSLIAGLLALSACAARPVTPIAMAQPGDDQLGCAELIRQKQANQRSVDELLRKDKDVETGNAVKAVVLGGLLGTAMMDLSNDEQVRARSLIDRNERLGLLARMKGCSEP